MKGWVVGWPSKDCDKDCDSEVADGYEGTEGSRGDGVVPAQPPRHACASVG